MSKNILTILYAISLIFSGICAALRFSTNSIGGGIIWSLSAVCWLICLLCSVGIF